MGEEYALQWAAATTLILAYLLFSLWRGLHDNRMISDPSAPLMGSLGPANAITVTRALFAAGLLGFLFIPRPAGWLAWIPGALFLAASLMDSVDGAVARISGNATLLGERLDMQWDSIGVLIASLLSIAYGQAPLPYALIGLARYLYLFALWIHFRQGGRVNELPPSRYRRGLGAMQMGFLAIILFPIFSPPWTVIVALLLMIPSLAGFLCDYLSVTNRIKEGVGDEHLRIARVHLKQWLPLGLRIGLACLLMGVLLLGFEQPSPEPGILLVAGLSIPLVLLGVTGRAAALGIILTSGFGAQTGWMDRLIWPVLVVSLLLFLTGTGKYSLWRPEDWLIDHRVGEQNG